ncbi:MAG: hypothetical protein ACO1QB_00625 [Verrucomicrobiales bacterium]
MLKRVSVWMALFALIFTLGCATNKVDWNSRLGTYTYDQAVLEMGVPERSATLSDGTIVAEWLSTRGTEYGTFHSFPGSRLQTYDVNRFPDRFLRLTFTPDGKLASVNKVAK